MKFINIKIETDEPDEIARVMKEIGRWIADGAHKGQGNSIGVEYQYEMLHSERDENLDREPS